MLTGSIDKVVWACYASEARVNIMDCINTTVDFRGGVALDDDGDIEQWIRFGQDTPESIFKLETRLRRYFRFLNAAYDVEPISKKDLKVEHSIPIPATSTPDPKRLERTLRLTFRLITQLRNTMMHPTAADAVLDKRDAKTLNNLFIQVYETGWRTTRSRRADKASLDGFCMRGKGGKIDEENPLFLFDYSATRNTEQGMPLGKVLTDYGFALLLSCFLSDRSTIELMSIVTREIPGLNESTRAVAIDIARVNCLWLPYRIRTSNTEDSVTIKVFNDLLRCPRTLYERLSTADKEHFHGELEDESEEQINLKNVQVKNAMLRSGEQRNVQLAMELMDFNAHSPIRFCISLGYLYHNIRIKPVTEYLDNKPRIRRIGNALAYYGRLQEYQEQQQGGRLPDRWRALQRNARIINQNLLHEHQAWITEELEQTTARQHIRLPSYLVEQYPRHAVLPERIGIRLFDKKKQVATSWPDIDTDRKTTQEISDVQLHDLGICRSLALKEVVAPLSTDVMAPEFTLSSNQLMHLSFLSVLIRNHAKPNEQAFFWSRYVTERLQHFRLGMSEIVEQIARHHQTRQTASSTAKPINDNTLAVLFHEEHSTEHYPIRPKTLPIALRRYLNGMSQTPLSDKQILCRMRRLLAQTEKLLSQIEFDLKSGKKRGKDGFKAIKCGHIAEFLSKDLLRFQPVLEKKDPETRRTPSDGGKVNSEHYQILQHTLAYYSKYLDEQPRIAELLRSCGFYKLGQSHPFLAQITINPKPDEHRGLLDFYHDYLSARKNYLSTEIDNFTNRVVRKQAEIDRNKGEKDTKNPLLKQYHWLGLAEHSTIDSWLQAHSREVSTDEWVLAYEEHPQPLPRDFFYRPVLELTAHALGRSVEELEGEGTRRFDDRSFGPSVTWLIAQYCDHRLGKAKTEQSFYSYKRSHKVFKKLKRHGTDAPLSMEAQIPMAEKVRVELTELKPGLPPMVARFEDLETRIDKEANDKKKKALQKEFDVLKKKVDYPVQLENHYRRFKRSEKMLRQQRAWDQVLYLLSENQMRNLLKAADEKETLPGLSNLDKNFLKRKISYRLPFYCRNKHNDDPRQAVLVARSISIKDMLRLQQMIQDRGMYDFLGFLPERQPEKQMEQASEQQPVHEPELLVEIYKAERTCYQRVRREVLEAVHRFEIHLVENLGKSDIAYSNTGKHVSHRELVSHFEDHLEKMNNQEGLQCFRETREQAIVMRNAVAHSTYPEDATLYRELTAEVHRVMAAGRILQPTIIERLGSETVAIYDRWTGHLHS